MHWHRILPLAFALFLLLPGPAAAESPLVLFDESHGQPFLAGKSGALDLSGLAEALEQAGASIEPLKEKISGEALSKARALIISGPFQPFADDEVTAIVRFVEGGGQLALMLHIAPPAANLLQAFGIVVSRGVVHETESLIGYKATDFELGRLEPHPVMAGLKTFGAYGAWALKNTAMNAYVIARTGPRAWIDTDGDKRFTPGEPTESLGIVIFGNHGKGAFFIFGDDAIFQNQFLKGGNLELARNLARWLAGN